MDWVLGTAYAALGAALILTLVRMVRGPTLTDRVVALDQIAYVFIAFTGVYAMEMDRAGILNVALALGAFVFLGTVAYARYLEAVVALREREKA